MKIPLVGPAYTLRAIQLDCQRCVNLFPETELPTSKDVQALQPTPGLTVFGTAPQSGCRGLWEATGRCFAVFGNTLYEFSTSGAATSRGFIAGSGPVGMVDDSVNLVIAAGSSAGYYLSLSTNVLTQYSAALYNGCAVPDYLDGYIIFNQPLSQTFYLSLPGDATTIYPAYSAAKEGFSDNLVRSIVVNRTLMLLGSETVEFWYDAGNSDFPFQLITGQFLEVGCAAAYSVCKVGNAVLWLANDKRGSGMVYMFAGAGPQRISTHAVEEAIQSYGDLSGSTAYTYQQDGHVFYVLNIPGAKTTWVYDMASGMWHERVYFVNGVEQRHLGQFACNCFNNVLVGDYQSGNLYIMDRYNYTDNGNVIERMRTFPHIHDEQKRIMFDYLQVDMLTGVGLNTGQGQFPKLMLSWSNDGGYTWSNEAYSSPGKMGKYRARARWRRLGYARDRVFKLRMTDPVQMVLIAGLVAVREEDRA
jgi:hypothetical protein